jgi:hypothetical protein
MGEIAESLINGEFDEITGEYIGKPCGYPRTQKRHHYTEKPATPNPKYTFWFLVIKHNNPHNISVEQLFLIAEKYAHGELKMQPNVREATVYKHIERDQERFKKWFELNYPHYYKNETK